MLAKLALIAVTLAWDPSITPDVDGYNLYSDGQRINNELISTLSYTFGVPSGIPYAYTARAVKNDLESADSNVVIHTAICGGDINNDQQRNLIDVILLANHIVGNQQLEGYPLDAADVNEDNEVNLFDIVQLQNIIVGNLPADACN